jgi:hypothetical protein
LDFQGRRHIATLGTGALFSLTCLALGWGHRKLQRQLELEEAQRIVALEFAQYEAESKGEDHHGASSSVD